MVYVIYHCPKRGIRSLFETSSKFRIDHSKFTSKFKITKTMYITMFYKKISKTSNKLRTNFDSKLRRSFEQTSNDLLKPLVQYVLNSISLLNLSWFVFQDFKTSHLHLTKEVFYRVHILCGEPNNHSIHTL